MLEFSWGSGKVKKGGQNKRQPLKVTSVSIEKLRPGSAQPRISFNDETLKELAASIVIHGVLQPLIVRALNREQFEIVAGERRWRAAKIARLKKVPCVIMDMLSEQALAIALVENVQREDLNAIEEAQAYVKLRSVLKLSQDEVASRVGKDRSSIANILRLLRLPKAVQDMVVNEELSMGHARALLSLDSADMMMMVAKKAHREGLSVRRVESIIRSIKNGISVFETKKEQGQAAENSLEREIKQKLEYEFGTKVDLKKEHNGYVVTIHFQSTGQLNMMLEKFNIEL